MTTGLLALLDDVTALVKISAASLDDISAQVVKTSGKVSGVVIDDAAVTPKYVVGLSPSRELAIIYNIAKRSLINKLLILGPAALVLGLFAPWAITPILMLGGTYLCFEGYEKAHAILHGHPEIKDTEQVEAISPEELEKMRTASAVRTDFILSAEIMAIAYSNVVSKGLLEQAMVLFSVAVGITVAVYGFVGLVVKADDIGLYLAKNGKVGLVRAVGRGLVKSMPGFLKILGYVGTAAMLWVGAEIIAHGVPRLHHALEVLHTMIAGPVLSWLAKVVVCALGGLLVGFVAEKLVRLLSPLRKKYSHLT